MRISTSRGFTLIELLVVIAIIGLLASVVLASLSTARVKARDARRMSDLNQLRTALELYLSAHGHYPPEIQACDSSRGVAAACPGSGSDWASTSDLHILITEGDIPMLPVDPTNDSTHYYSFESNNIGQAGCTVNTCSYSLAARMEGTGQWYYVYNP